MMVGLARFGADWRLHAVLTLATVGAMLLAGQEDGRPTMPPLDDVFIHLQYARSIAEGHPFEYIAGDAPSSGASSVLYALVLSPLFVLGVDRHAAVLSAMLLGCVLWSLTAQTLGRALTRERGPVVGLAASLAVYAWGWGAFHAASGMEGALTAFLVTLLVERSVRWVRAPRHARDRWALFTLVALGLLVPWARPDAAPFALLVFALVVVEPPRRGADRGFALLLGLAPIEVTLFWRVVTGEALPNGALAKLLVVDPVLTEAQIHEWVGRNLVDAGATWSGTSQLGFLPPAMVPLGFGLATLGVLWQARRGRRRRPVVWLFAVVSVAITLSMTTYATFGSHFHRYLVPYVVVPVAVAITSLAAPLTLLRGRLSRSTQQGLELTAMLVGLVALSTTFDGLHARTARCVAELRGYHGAVNQFLATVETSRPILVTDAGAHAYLLGRPTLDVIGLATQGFALDYRAGAGAQLEAYSRLPADRRPDLAVSFFSVGWWQPAGSLLDASIFRVTLGGENQIAGGPMYEVVRLRPELVLDQELPDMDGGVLDRIDFADLLSERDHAMPWPRGHAALFGSVIVRRTTPAGRDLVEGCRELVEPLAFELRAARAGALVLRLAPTTSGMLRVRIGGAEHALPFEGSDRFVELDLPLPEAPEPIPVHLQREHGSLAVCHGWSVAPR